MMTKDSGLRIRVQRELREEFLDVCRALDKPGAQVIRELMREYIARRKSDVVEEAEATLARRSGRVVHDH